MVVSIIINIITNYNINIIRQLEFISINKSLLIKSSTFIIVKVIDYIISPKFYKIY